jgi:hypothetical protein
MTRLWIFSDLHYEMGNSNPPAAPEHDVCIVPGDLNQLYWAIDQLRSGEMGNGTTIYVPGNHDYYRQDCMEAAERMAKQSVKLTKVFLANPGEYCFGGIRFLGCTLWSDYALYGNAEKAMRDAAPRNDGPPADQDGGQWRWPSSFRATTGNIVRRPHRKTIGAQQAGSGASGALHARTRAQTSQARAGVVGRALKRAIPGADRNLQPSQSIAKKYSFEVRWRPPLTGVFFEFGVAGGKIPTSIMDSWPHPRFLRLPHR